MVLPDLPAPAARTPGAAQALPQLLRVAAMSSSRSTSDYTQPTGTWPLMDGRDDAACRDCGQPLPEGAPYSEFLNGVGPDFVAVQIVCVYCALIRPRAVTP